MHAAPASPHGEQDMQMHPEQVYDVSSQAVRRELRLAVRQLRDCGLHRSSTWAAEQLVGLRDDDPVSSTAAAALAAPEQHVNGDDSDLMLLARDFFNAKVGMLRMHPSSHTQIGCCIVRHIVHTVAGGLPI